MKPSDLTSNTAVFQFKGSTLTITVLELIEPDLNALKQQLADKVKQAPNLFNNTPLILALDKLTNPDITLDLNAIVSLCREFSLFTVAIRSQRADDIRAAQQLYIPVINVGQEKQRATVVSQLQSPKDTTSTPLMAKDSANSATLHKSAKVIHQPVRSGQQIVAKNCDLIVMSSVSAGAELLSDGNIHVYGALRGRALAGLSGDTNAGVYCQQMAAELVSIAGQYKVAEDLRRSPLWEKACCIMLEDDQLIINAL